MKSNAISGRSSVTADQTPSSPLARIISSSVGSILYVLTFNPLEVVKIRQQAAAVNNTSGNVVTYSSPSLPSSSPSPVKAYLRGRGAVMLNNGLMLPQGAFPCLVAPQYHIATPASFCSRLESSVCIPGKIATKSKETGGIIRTLLSIARTEGRAALYAGTRPALLVAVPNTAIYLTAYDEITMQISRRYQIMEKNGELDESSTAKQKICIPLIAGATARLISSVATAPLEVIRTRQASGSTKFILEEFHFLVKMHGPMALYRGLGPMIMRDVPFSSIYFLCFERFKNELSESNILGARGVNYYREHGLKAPISVEVVHAFLSGAAAGSIATLVTTPFDLVKTRRQIVQQAGMEKAANQGTFCYMKQIVREEGFFAGLWRGNSTRMAKVVPGTALMISCYELGKRMLDDVL